MAKSSKNPRAGIYAIIHKDSSRRYVGQSQDVERRLKEHGFDLRSGRHSNPELQRYWREYGAEAFEFSILALAPIRLSPLNQKRWLIRKELEYWEDASFNRFNSQHPELVESAEAIREYENEKRDETKEITKQIRVANELLERISRLERPPLQPISRLKQEIHILKSAHWRASGWRKMIFWSQWFRDTQALEGELGRKKLKLKELVEAYEQKDKLRRTVLDFRKKLYNSYPGNKEKKAKRYDVGFGVYGGKIKAREKKIWY